MALPNVVTYSLTAGYSTWIVNAVAATSSPLALATAFVPSYPLQQRVVVTSAGDDHLIYFHIVGLNQAGFTIGEFLPGTNATYAQSQLDYSQIISIRASNSSNAQVNGSTANTVSVGTSTTGGVGSTMWNIMNWHVAPTNIECAGVVTSTSTTVNWGVQYTYDDPNNLPAGVGFPQPFNHPTLNNLSASLDAPINDPVTGVRFIINSGTGVLRGTIIQAGIGSP